MIENNEYENQLSHAAGITVTCLKWHRGHEVADLDNYWLTLESDQRTVARHFPNAWLEDFGKSDDDQRIAQRLSNMVQTLGAGPKT